MAIEDFLEYDGPKDAHPVWKNRVVWIDVQIRHNESGEVRTTREWAIYEPQDGETPNAFMYEEGNYSCDCNRHLFFHRAVGVEPDDHDCGDGAYSVNLVNPKNGQVYYQEF
jgi:hypothetical protein